jgi:hypothetical protein
MRCSAGSCSLDFGLQKSSQTECNKMKDIFW